MKAKKIAFTGIPVTDMKRARAFYEGVLGLKVSGEFGEGVWIEYEIGPDTLAIGSVGDPKTAPASLLKSKTLTPPSRVSNRRRLVLPPKELRVLYAGWPSCRIRTAIS
jgi:hypothetical protein